MVRRKSVGSTSGLLHPRVKVWLEKDDTYAFGFGISQILDAVERAGSIKQGAHDLGKSYRHVWDRIKEAEASIGRSLVETRVGGTGTRRSFLTEEARQLVDAFLTLRENVKEFVEAEFRRRFPAQLRRG